jgi:hypothetical protein
LLLVLLLLLLFRVVVTGHSLGAALATLGAFWLKTIMPSVGDSGTLLLQLLHVVAVLCAGTPAWASC